jgi:hypothetical protein
VPWLLIGLVTGLAIIVVVLFWIGKFLIS